MSGPIYNAVRHSNGGNGSSTGVRQVSPTGSNFSGTTANSITKGDLKDATRARKGFAVFTAVLFAIALIFLLLINIGNVANVNVVRDLWFFKIDISRIVPDSGGQQTVGAGLIGLKDFYQVGLWNFCEGTKDAGITACSKPVLMYWFNPVQIVVDEVLNGTKVSLPQEVVDYLTTARNASHLMFGCFFASTFSSFLAIFLCPLAVYSRLSSIPIATFALLSSFATLVAAATSSAMWAIMRRSILDAADGLKVEATIGTKMTVFAWVAAGCALWAAFGQLCLMCCGTSRRDIKTGRRVGRRQRQEKAIEENPALRRRWWGSVSQ